MLQIHDDDDSHVVEGVLEEDEARAVLGAVQPVLGPVHHLELAVTDLRRSEAWDTGAFGLVRIDGEIAEDSSGYLALVSPTGGWVLALCASASPAVRHVAFTCADRAALVAWRDALAAKGLTRDHHRRALRFWLRPR